MMLDFCNRHAIEPVIEEFPLSRVNEARHVLKRVKHDIVLRNDFKSLDN
jgi:alcohol/geraniol dehydrogenase (NADP+)